MKNQFLREFRKLSPAGRGKVLKYAVWLLSTEKRERLAGLRDRDPASQVSGSYDSRKGKRPLLTIRKRLSWLGSHA